MGISLRMDDGYYDLCPLDWETHNTGSPMLKHVLVFGYAESGVNNHDALNNCKVFELSLKSRYEIIFNKRNYILFISLTKLKSYWYLRKYLIS